MGKGVLGREDPQLNHKRLTYCEIPHHSLRETKYLLTSRSSASEVRLWHSAQNLVKMLFVTFSLIVTIINPL